MRQLAVVSSEFWNPSSSVCLGDTLQGPEPGAVGAPCRLPPTNAGLCGTQCASQLLRRVLSAGSASHAELLRTTANSPTLEGAGKSGGARRSLHKYEVS